MPEITHVRVYEGKERVCYWNTRARETCRAGRQTSAVHLLPSAPGWTRFMPPEGTTVDQVCKHITDCFGWTTTLVRR